MDYERNVWKGDARRAEDAEAQNLGLLTRAYSAFSVEMAAALPGPKSYALGMQAAHAVIDCDTVGAMGDADRYLQLVVKNPEFDWRFGDGQESDSEKLVAHLVMTARLKEAESLCHAFLEAAERAEQKKNPFMQGVRSKMAIRKCSSGFWQRSIEIKKRSTLPLNCSMRKLVLDATIGE